MTRKQIYKSCFNLRVSISEVGDEEREAVAKVKKKYAKLAEAYKNKIREIQEQCRHEHTNYTPDPSGGHDSCLDCADCGKALR